MPNIFIEKQSSTGSFHAIRNESKITQGNTQNECGCNAKKLHPDDPLLAERVENAKRGNPDHWRRFYPTC